MKKSIYNFIVKHNNYFMLFNALYGTSIILNNEEFNNFNNFSCNEENNSALIKMGFYVDNEIDEVKLYLTRNRFSIENSNNLSFRIFTTTKCNAKCFYCYEHGVETFDMTKETADEVITFITNRLIGQKSLNIQWFGGEPLVNYEIINYIIDKINPYLKANNIMFSSTMVSNGLLFNENIVKMAKEIWNLKKIQITLDGYGEDYNRIKNYWGFL